MANHVKRPLKKALKKHKGSQSRLAKPPKPRLLPQRPALAYTGRGVQPPYFPWRYTAPLGVALAYVLWQGASFLNVDLPNPAMVLGLEGQPLWQGLPGYYQQATLPYSLQLLAAYTLLGVWGPYWGGWAMALGLGVGLVQVALAAGEPTWYQPLLTYWQNPSAGVAVAALGSAYVACCQPSFRWPTAGAAFARRLASWGLRFQQPPSLQQPSFFQPSSPWVWALGQKLLKWLAQLLLFEVMKLLYWLVLVACGVLPWAALQGWLAQGVLLLPYDAAALALAGFLQGPLRSVLALLLG
jgi:hypothetical protein